MTRWQVEHRRGRAADLHEAAWPDPLVPTVWVMEVERMALVLGSTQRDADLVVPPAGVDVVRRHSGGGAVWLDPAGTVWVDVLLPRAHPAWDDDVGRATHWLGEAWASALGRPATVHRGGLVRSELSRSVCFAGLGPGEVTIGGRKAVGISQRRTRAGARFQCVAYERWDPGPLAGALGLDPAMLEDAGTGVPTAGLVDRLLVSLA